MMIAVFAVAQAVAILFCVFALLMRPVETRPPVI
jgi:hypothetical protein